MPRSTTPKTPVVPLSIWTELYSVAQQFNSLQPWKLFDDDDLVSVRDPSSGETGYGAAMGSLGTLFGFCLYRGAAGFDLYRRMMKNEIGEAAEDIFALQNCLIVSFSSRQDLQSEDREVIKQLKLMFKGKTAWPEFRSHLPGYTPWFLTEGEAHLLTLGLRAACRHYKRVMNGEVDGSLTEKECLVYTPVDESQTAFRADWEPVPVFEKAEPPLPVLNLAALAALQNKKLQPDTAWEADVFYLMSPVFERNRPQFARITALCQETSGFVFGVTPAFPEDGESQLLADEICSMMAQKGLKPETVFVRNKQLAEALAPLAKVLGITVRAKKKLTTINEIKKEMMKFFARGK